MINHPLLVTDIRKVIGLTFTPLSYSDFKHTMNLDYGWTVDRNNYQTYRDMFSAERSRILNIDKRSPYTGR